MAPRSQAATDGLVAETLRLCIASGGQSEASAEAAKSAAGAAVGVAADPLSDEAAKVVGELGRDDAFQRATLHEYGLLKQWLDMTHKGWEARCGLSPRVQPDGSVEWMPPV